jgi:hypothetical protein
LIGAQLPKPGTLKKVNSCSTIYIDHSTVSQPDLVFTIECVTLAIYYHIKNRTTNNIIDIFDEKTHPISVSTCPLFRTNEADREVSFNSCQIQIHFLQKHWNETNPRDPDHRMIYRYMRNLFNAAQLSSECAIITLVYLERLLGCADVSIGPLTWRRIILGAILLASKVWDDQAVWNLDFCQILKDISIEDMLVKLFALVYKRPSNLQCSSTHRNELERHFLEFIQFNINVSSSVYAKYYFDLRTLAKYDGFNFPVEPLSNERAQELEAMSRVTQDKLLELHRSKVRRCSSVDNLAQRRRSRAILS